MEEVKTNKLEIFETVPINKAVKSLAVPMIISQLIMLIYNLADTFFLGKTGDTNQVAAVTLAFPIFMMISVIANLFGIGGGSLVSRLLGEARVEEAGKVSSFIIWAGGITALFLSALMVILLPSLLGMLGADESTYGFAADYIRYTVIIGGLPSVLNMILSQLVRAGGAAKAASVGMSMGGIINLILDPILILGLHMNVAGAALATCISNTIAMIFYMVYLYKTRNTSPFHTHIFAKLPSTSLIGQIFAIGTPAALTVLLASVSNSLMMSLMSGYSGTAIAGLGVAQKIELIPFYIVQGISSGVLPVLAFNYAAGNYERMHAAVKTAIRLGIIVAVTAFILIELSASGLVHIFINSTEAINYGAAFTRLRCLALPFITVEFMFIAVFQGIGSAKQALVLSFFRKGIFDLPVMFCLNMIWPLYGLMLVQPIMECMGAVIAVIMYRVKMKKINVG